MFLDDGVEENEVDAVSRPTPISDSTFKVRYTWLLNARLVLPRQLVATATDALDNWSYSSAYIKRDYLVV